MMDRLRAMQMFVKVADGGSFTEAARELGVTAAAVSKQIARLETHLATQLVTRTTRTSSLTDAGRRYADDCRGILSSVHEAEAQVRDEAGAVRGNLRVTAPRTFGRARVAPVLAELLQSEPELTAETLFTDDFVDLAASGFDVALRVASSLDDSSWVGRRIGAVRNYLVASPAYLERHGTPRRPDALRRHRALWFRPDDLREGWAFANGARVRPEVVLKSGDLSALAECALRGVGIAELPDYVCAAAVREGSLRRILPRSFRRERAVWALQSARSRLTPRRVSAFVARLAHAMSSPSDA